MILSSCFTVLELPRMRKAKVWTLNQGCLRGVPRLFSPQRSDINRIILYKLGAVCAGAKMSERVSRQFFVKSTWKWCKLRLFKLFGKLWQILWQLMTGCRPEDADSLKQWLVGHLNSNLCSFTFYILILILLTIFSELRKDMWVVLCVTWYPLSHQLLTRWCSASLWNLTML